MTLQEIANIKNEAGLYKAVMFLSDNIERLGYKESSNYIVAIQDLAARLGYTYSELHMLASQYQLYGYLPIDQELRK